MQNYPRLFVPNFESLDLDAFRPVLHTSVETFVDYLCETFPRAESSLKRSKDDRHRVDINCGHLFPIDHMRQDVFVTSTSIDCVPRKNDLDRFRKVVALRYGTFSFRSTLRTDVDMKLTFSAVRIHFVLFYPEETDYDFTPPEPGVFKPLGPDHPAHERKELSKTAAGQLEWLLDDLGLGEIKELHPGYAVFRKGNRTYTVEHKSSGGQLDFTIVIDQNAVSQDSIDKHVMADAMCDVDWVDDHMWQQLASRLNHIPECSYFGLMSSADYAKLHPTMNEYWPFGWNLSVLFEKDMAYENPDDVFIRPSYATNEVPVRCPIVGWQRDKSWLQASVVHTADCSFPELLIGGSDAYKKRTLKKLDEYEFEHWDGPLIKRWT